MTIKTKFNAGDSVITINNNRVVRLKVIKVITENTNVSYQLLVSKATQLIDKDITIHREEYEVFKSITALASYFRNLTSQTTN